MMSPEPQQGALIGAILSRRFRLVRLLGEGGMGSVYAAETLDGAPPVQTPRPGQPPQGGQRVAIKVLKPEFLADVEVLARFLEEARTCQRLIHPNILRVFESGTAEDGTPYIVMELLDGVPLSAYTKSGGRVPIAQAITILQGILAGLAHAHAQGVIHRDLKPENVFLAREPSGHFQVKLVDFGIAKVMDLAGGMGSRTKTGILLGTPAYMSPEQIKNAKDVDARADVWSAGVMGWEMLSGRVAFPAPTEYARLTAVLTHEPEPLEAIDPAFATVSPIVARAMRKDRDERFASALEMARALAAAHGDVVASRISPGAASREPALVAPLSRLPDVPSLFAIGSEPSPAASSESHTAAALPFDDAAPPMPRPTGGGTLPSAPPPPDLRLHEGSPEVALVGPPQGTTMPSKDLPMLQPVASGKPRIARGVASWIVVVLVVSALAAGFLLGFAVGRSAQ